MDESISNLRMLGSKFSFHSNFKKNQSASKHVESDQAPCSAASDLVLHRLLTSHKRSARLKWVKTTSKILFLYNLCLFEYGISNRQVKKNIRNASFHVVI